jgi:hypothetical protein
VRTPGIEQHHTCTNTLHDSESNLPDYIAIAPHVGDDPHIQPRENEADEAVMDHPPHNALQRYDERGGGGV